MITVGGHFVIISGTFGPLTLEHSVVFITVQNLVMNDAVVFII